MGGTHWYCCSQGNMVIVVKTTINELQLLQGPSGKYNFKYIQYHYHYKVSPMMIMMSWSPEDEIYFSRPGARG